MEDLEKVSSLEKNDIIDVVITDYGSSGEGVAHYNGKAIFIRGAIVGEHVSAKIILVKKDFAVAILHKINRASAERATPICAVFLKCGGCSMQHISYESQLKIKAQKVENALRRAGKISFEVAETVPSKATLGYRNKLSLPLRGLVAEAGFFAQNTHRIVPQNSCPIQFKASEKLLKITLDYLHANNIPGYNETTGQGLVRHLVARHIGGITIITLVVNGALTPPLKALNEVYAKNYGNTYAFYINFNTKMDNVILGERTQFIGGNQDNILIDGFKINVHPKSFFQVNDDVRVMLYNRVSSSLGSAPSSVLDAYAGAGVLTAHIAKAGHSVIGVEIDSAAVDAAKNMFSDNNIAGAKMLCGDCKDIIPKLIASGAKDSEGGADVLAQNTAKFASVILDPPRSGCAAEVINAVLTSGIKTIVYISCNPATLARDIALLQTAYTIKTIVPYDMFPQTAEVECFCTLELTNKQ